MRSVTGRCVMHRVIRTRPVRTVPPLRVCGARVRRGVLSPTRMWHHFHMDSAWSGPHKRQSAQVLILCHISAHVLVFKV